MDNQTRLSPRLNEIIAKLDYLVDGAERQREVNERICASLDRIEAKLDKLDEML